MQAIFEAKASIHRQDRRGDIVSLIGYKKCRCVPNLFRQAQTSPGELLTFSGDRFVRKGDSFAGCIDPTGFDGIDVYSMWRQLDGNRSHQVIQSRLGCSVRCTIGDRNFCLDARNENNLATLSSQDHLTSNKLADMKSTGQRAIDRPLKFLGGILEKCSTSAVSGIADQNVDSTGQFDGRLD